MKPTVFPDLAISEEHSNCPLGLWMNLEFDLIKSLLSTSLNSWDQHDSVEIALLKCLTETSVLQLLTTTWSEVGCSIPSLHQIAEITLSNGLITLADSVNSSTKTLFQTLLGRSEGSLRREILVLASAFNLPRVESGLDIELEEISREMPRIGNSIFDLSKLGSLISRVSLSLNNTHSK